MISQMKDGFVLRTDEIIDKMSWDRGEMVPAGRLCDRKRPLVGDAMSGPTLPAKNELNHATALLELRMAQVFAQNSMYVIELRWISTVSRSRVCDSSVIVTSEKRKNSLSFCRIASAGRTVELSPNGTWNAPVSVAPELSRTVS